MAIIFTDTFTVGADTNIDAYPAGDPDYAYNAGTGNNIIVSGANDRVENNATGSTFLVAIIDGAVPADMPWYRVNAATVSAAAADQIVSPAVQVGSNGEDEGYFLYWDNATQLSVYRRVTSTDTLVASLVLPETAPTTDMFLEVQVGTSVALRWGVGIYSAGTIDTNAARLTTGRPGIYTFASAGTPFLDTLTVDEFDTTFAITNLQSVRHIPKA
jgi:hypothetical protein